jgi:predicted dienelactone hydrolase
MTFDDGNTERPITGAIWYPAIQPEGVEEAIVYDLGVSDLTPMGNEIAGRAILDAVPNTAGPYPLIVSSNGMGATHYWTAYVYEHLASHGFVVMALDHPGNTFRDQNEVSSEETWKAFIEAAFDSMVMRPMDISQTIDYAETLAGSDGAMAGVIDMEHIGVIGYSFGGYTALAAAGGQLDFSGMPALCESGMPASMITNLICMLHAEDLPDLEARLLEVAGVEAEPGQMWPSFADARIDAIVPLAPGGGSVIISDEGYAGIVTPMLIVRAGGDELAVPAYNADRAWAFSNSPLKAMLTLEYAGHFVVGQCPADVLTLDPACVEPVWDKDRAHDLINHFTTAFLLAELYGDEEARAALAPDAVAFPGIGYEAVGY